MSGGRLSKKSARRGGASGIRGAKVVFGCPAGKKKAAGPKLKSLWCIYSWHAVARWMRAESAVTDLFTVCPKSPSRKSYSRKTAGK